MTEVAVAGLTKRFVRTGPVAVDDVSFVVPAGSVTCLLGPSGCGKSTILGAIAGIVSPDAGRVLIGGRDMDGIAAHRRPVTLVLQSAPLFPHLSVLDNVAFGLQVRGVDRRARHDAARQLLDVVALGALADRRPAGLSGGEAQRVAFARALAARPEVLLLDEPLASLDAAVRRELQDVLVDLHRRFATTVVLVTHDLAEAVALADRLVLLDTGRVVATGPTAELYERPPNVAAARLLGATNIWPVTLDARGMDTPLGRLPVPPGAGRLAPGAAWLIIRPEHVEVASTPDRWTVAAEVDDRRYQGAAVELRLRAGGQALRAVVAAPTAQGLAAGVAVGVRLPPEHLVLVGGDARIASTDLPGCLPC